MQWIKRIAVAGVVAFVVIQLVPYGRDHSNPPVLAEPAWDSPTTRELAERACFDCHSNESVWPWYSNIAPVSWLVERDVEEGRRKLNFSEWPSGEGDEAAETVRDGSMPPGQYLITHPEARLTDAELEILAGGLSATLGDDEGAEDDGGDDDDGDDED